MHRRELNASDLKMKQTLHSERTGTVLTYGRRLRHQIIIFCSLYFFMNFCPKIINTVVLQKILYSKKHRGNESILE